MTGDDGSGAGDVSELDVSVEQLERIIVSGPTKQNRLYATPPRCGGERQRAGSGPFDRIISVKLPGDKD